MSIHLTFHVSKVKPVPESSLVPPTLPRMVEDGPVYAVRWLLRCSMATTL